MHASIMMVVPLDIPQEPSPAKMVSPLGYFRRELDDIQHLITYCNTIFIGNYFKLAN